MSNEEKDLWPNFEDVPKITSPRSVMSEQASFLSQKTKNLLTANISTNNTSDGRIVNRFAIVAPLLKNYSYNLFALYHGAIYYPCEILFKGVRTPIQNEEELRTAMSSIFNDESTKKVIVSLIGQSKELDSSS
ncbi:MAG TPA: hypothetical protein PKC72_10955 [Chitinophagaceae bacterium]|nr:hypothetical protein [Chitinophagaceae bacterium]